MNTYHLRTFRRAFANYDWTRKQRRVYAKKWVTCIRYLGSNWLIAQPISNASAS
jgi:hypothetical protein